MSDPGGVYDVLESGVEFRHMPEKKSVIGEPQDYLDRFKSNFQLRILEQNENDTELVFEMIGIDVSLANALRRIMLAEIPTMAIEHVYMWNNSSIIHDEVLAHRIGLIPIACDPRMFEPIEDESQATDRNTLVFRLAVSCEKPKKKQDDTTIRTPPAKSFELQQPSPNPAAATADLSIGGDPAVDRAAEIASENYHGANAAAIEIPGRPYTKHVYSSDLQWIPQGDQEERFASVGGIKPVHDDILIAKLRPGQAIELEAHARLGDGKDHAKYSPVATACYRLMPVIELLHDVYDDLAEELDKYEPGVFAIVPCADPNSGQRRKKAVVRNPYACTMSRNYMRNPELKKAVKISRKPDHFIFSVEAVGMLPASTIVAESIRVLRDKCQNIIRLADESLESELLNK